MKQIIIATKNKGKVKDFEVLFKSKGYDVISLLDIQDSPDIDETGTTFKENAILKAEGIASIVNEIVIADDSGLAIDALEGRPGVMSARYAGEQKNDEDNIQKVLSELKGENNRRAAFHCALAMAIPSKPTVVVEGTCNGVIAEQPVGENGFGYDPIFFVHEKNKTMAQLTKEEKNTISHRADALKKLEVELNKYLEL
ncbi:XTP/dITP diphosphatase [Bacillus suaedaesalsae]|uniref:dITP/XTP pyrophosphatase n=1 Tax=Bacillus suaedaesalsae TaxID=2810349 RepID=A0ABS2DNR5_9BACI|nr:XTP/dITP diphosphatase [Bacillus suaedaesalsae]MBM6619785.1 XTP/dITP diphosphatase [Bacillus suaedaesalsae]